MVDLVAERAGEELRPLVRPLLAVGVEALHDDARRAHRRAPEARYGKAALVVPLLALGLDYRYGGNSPVTGFDCSGLVAHVYLEAWNIRLPHNTLAQSEKGAPVSLAELRAGDLVFYGSPIHHVGMFVGNGTMIEAPYTGVNVRYHSIYRPDFAGAARP